MYACKIPEMSARNLSCVQEICLDTGAKRIVYNTHTVTLYVAQRPNAGSSVKLRYEAHLMDGTLFDERKEGDELTVLMEEGAPHSPHKGYSHNWVLLYHGAVMGEM